MSVDLDARTLRGSVAGSTELPPELESPTELRNQRICAACGLIFAFMLMVGFAIAQFIPPPAPTDTADMVAQRFQEDTNAIRLGFIFTMLGAAFIPPWCVALYSQLKHVKGQGSTMAVAQLCTGILNALLFMLPAMLWEVTAYRADERSAETTQAINDIATIIFICPFSFGLIQCLAIAIAVLQDPSRAPVYPRWVAYFNVWAGLIFAAGALTVFFKHGPFAWDGFFAYWVPLTVYCAWFVVMYVVTIRAIRIRESAALSPSTEIG